MKIFTGKHKGKLVSELSLAELQDMCEKMTSYYKQITQLLTAVNKELAGRSDRPKSVSENTFKIE